MWVTWCLVGLCLCRMGAHGKEIDIKMGLMMPSFDPYLKLKLGFPTTASAATMALERVRKEGLLPDVKFKIIWNFTDCEESLSAGVGVELFRGDAVDVIIGPACSTEAVVIGVLGKHFNLPIFSWAAIGPELEDKVRFPTLVRTIGSAKRLGRVMKEFLLFFRWQRIAMIVTDDHAQRKCFFVARGIHEAFSRTLITFELRVELDYTSPTDKDMISFIEALKFTSRIVIVCMDLIEDRRRFMIFVQERLNVDDYVFIFPDYMPEEGKIFPWIDYNGINDGRDDEARKAFQKSFILEFQQADAKKLDEFKRTIPNKMKEWPFYYDPMPDEQYGSTYSPFMYDATYLYALALNKTLRMGGSKRDGRMIFDNSRNTFFEGMSGPVNIDDIGDREPDFIIKGFDQQSQFVIFIEAQMSKAEGQMINLKYPEWQLWETRKSKSRPRDTPACGFYEELCVTSEDYTGLIIAIVGVILILLVCAGVGIALYVRKKLNQSTVRKGMWKVSFGDIVKLDQVDLKSRTLSSGSQITLESLGSIGSLGSHPSRKFENAELAFFKGALVWVRNHHHNISINHNDYQTEFRMMWELTHQNLNRFIGLCVDSPVPLSLWKYNSKGSLKDVIKNESVKLNWLFMYSLIKDLTDGMEYLHFIPIGSHGRLKPSNCVIDSRWVLKVTDFGLTKIRSFDKPTVDQLMWTAPELLRMGNPPTQGTPKADIYSFAIILQQLITRSDAYCGYEDDMTQEEILMHVKKSELPSFRPIIKLPDGSDVNQQILMLIKDCWHENPPQRPEFKVIKGKLKAMEHGKHIDLMDHVLNMMERYAGTLESQIGERTKQLVEEKKKSDLLLYRMLPRSIADKLKAGQRIDPESYEAATVFFSDIVGFTALSNRSNPLQIVSLLNDLFGQFDETIDEYDVYKVETIGDGYMCVSGLPHRNGNKHASEIADLSLHFQRIIKDFIIPHMPGESMKLRIGVHSGPCVTGVVGLKLPRFCLFGDTVNTASRMESHGKAGCIHITEEANHYLTKVIGGYRTKPRGELIVKGKGVLNTFWLLGKVGAKNIEDQTDVRAGKDATALGSSSPPVGPTEAAKVPLTD